MNISQSPLTPGKFIYWKERIYRISAIADNMCSLEVTEVSTSTQCTFTVEELYTSSNECPAPIFADTIDDLLTQINGLLTKPQSLSESGLDELLLNRAQELIDLESSVQARLSEAKRKAILARSKFRRTQALKEILAELPTPIHIRTWYKYTKFLKKHGRDKARMAAAMRRSTYKRPRLSKTQFHFTHTILMRFFGRGQPIKALEAYRTARSILERTGNLWPDPRKCGGEVPENVLNELLDDKLPIDVVLNNPEKAAIMSPIELPSRAWFYRYLRYFETQPDGGKAVYIARHGLAQWEQEYMAFDTFVARAAMALEFVFADHYLLDVFIVDEETRSVPIRLWLTVLIDAYSRCILGFALLYENPCIESIQTALQHAIWPKPSYSDLGINLPWICFGLMQFLSLDNAWSHHSHSLENLARVISRDGKYPNINLLFRPPYMARYGALVERFFGSLSARIKSRLPGAIQSRDPKDVQNAAKEACLLYSDIYRFVLDEIVNYHHTIHSELGGMTPHEKWLEGTQSIIPAVPPLTPETKRLFLRMYYDTRQIGSKGIPAFGMHYWSDELQTAQRREMNGKPVEYSFRFDPNDISWISLFHDGIWIADLYAKELLRPDGSVRSISLWELETAKKAVRGKRHDQRDWLAYFNEQEKLIKQRRQEKRKSQRKTKPHTSSQDRTSHLPKSEDRPDDNPSDLTNSAASFLED